MKTKTRRDEIIDRVQQGGQVWKLYGDWRRGKVTTAQYEKIVQELEEEEAVALSQRPLDEDGPFERSTA